MDASTLISRLLIPAAGCDVGVLEGNGVYVGASVGVSVGMPVGVSVGLSGGVSVGVSGGDCVEVMGNGMEFVE